MIKSIPNFPDYYADVEGNIYTSIVYINQYSKKTDINNLKKLKSTKLKSGHLYVSLEGGKKKLIHQLVLETFIGPCPEGMECRHMNGNPGNNSLFNIKWDTRSNNQKDRVKHGTSNRGERYGGSKLNELQVRIIKYLLKYSNMTHQEIANIFNVCRENITGINNNKIWFWLGNKEKMEYV